MSSLKKIIHNLVVQWVVGLDIVMQLFLATKTNLTRRQLALKVQRKTYLIKNFFFTHLKDIVGGKRVFRCLFFGDGMTVWQNISKHQCWDGIGGFYCIYQNISKYIWDNVYGIIFQTFFL